jgi:hypothetical protein
LVKKVRSQNSNQHHDGCYPYPKFDVHAKSVLRPGGIINKE